jgi:hypothetical protein
VNLDHERPRSINGAPIGLLSDHFTGREKELVLLREMFDKEKSGRPNCCVIYGMPGIGKSQLSLHYAKISFDLGQYSHIFWTSATSVDKLNQGFTEILNLVGHRDRYLQDQRSKVTAARLWLEEPHGDDVVNWLVVFDNVDRSTLGFIRTHLPQKNVRGNILFVTRTRDFAETLVTAAGHRDRILKLEALGLRDTANLLLNDAGIEGSVTPSLLRQAEELVECVGRLPLAVVQASSFMKETDTNLDGMLKLYKSEQKIKVSSCYCCLAPIDSF